MLYIRLVQVYHYVQMMGDCELRVSGEVSVTFPCSLQKILNKVRSKLEKCTY